MNTLSYKRMRISFWLVVWRLLRQTNRFPGKDRFSDVGTVGDPPVPCSADHTRSWRGCKRIVIEAI